MHPVVPRLLGTNFPSIVGLALAEHALVGAKELEDLFGQRLDLLGGSEMRGRRVSADAMHKLYDPAQLLPRRAKRGILAAECLLHTAAQWQRRRAVPKLLPQAVSQHRHVSHGPAQRGLMGPPGASGMPSPHLGENKEHG